MSYNPVTAGALDAMKMLALKPGAFLPPMPRNPAESAVARLSEHIADFEHNLTADEEVGAVIIGAPDGTCFHIVKCYSLNMDLVVFEGLNAHKKPQRLVQHVTQLNILLTALPKLDETPRRIGFVVTEPAPAAG